MRAAELLARRSPAERADLAGRLRAAGVDIDALVAAMRGAELREHLARFLDTPMIREDLALLCANPFDAVHTDELVDPERFRLLGLIERLEDNAFRVNLDMALALVRTTPVEFGFLATLLTRLGPADLAVASRAAGVGPRPGVIDQVIDTSEALRRPDTIARHIALLRADERTILNEALRLGELPDDIASFPTDAPPPEVRLDDGEAGRLGLVFRVHAPLLGLDQRPVVPLELAPTVRDLLKRVPPAPEIRAARTRKPRESAPRGDRTAPTRSSPTAEPNPATAPTAPFDPARQLQDLLNLRNPVFAPAAPPADLQRRPTGPGSTSQSVSVRRVGTGSGTFTAVAIRRADDDVEANESPRAAKVARAATIVPVSALVDLRDPRRAAQAQRDPELRADILDIVADHWVLLRPGADVDDWVRRCTLRLETAR